MKKEILNIENIVVGCESCTSDEAIVACGNMFVEKGYVEEPYIQGMLNRDHGLSVYIGNSLAIPHGEYEVSKHVKETGIVVRIYPKGIDWHGEQVNIVIGIAAQGDEHMAILSNIAVALCEMDVVEQVIKCNDATFIHNVLTQGA